MTGDEPLEDLYVDSAEINNKRLSKALSDIIGINRDAGKTVILEGFSDLNQSEKVFAYLLSRRVAHALGHVEEYELGMSASEIEKETGVPQGTIRRYCSESRLVESDDEKGGYIIPSYAISQAIDELGGD